MRRVVGLRRASPRSAARNAQGDPLMKFGSTAVAIPVALAVVVFTSLLGSSAGAATRIPCELKPSAPTARYQNRGPVHRFVDWKARATCTHRVKYTVVGAGLWRHASGAEEPLDATYASLNTCARNTRRESHCGPHPWRPRFRSNGGQNCPGADYDPADPITGVVSRISLYKGTFGHRFPPGRPVKSKEVVVTFASVCPQSG